MIPLTKPLRAWRVIYNPNNHWDAHVQRRTVLAESPEEAVTLARIRYTTRLTGYVNATYEPTITDVKPFVRLAEL